MRKDENGYIVVETVLAFMLFVFLNLSILTLINIVTVQSRVHYAITQTANELSMYSYIIEATGLSDAVMGMGEAGGEGRDLIDSVIGDVNTIRGGVSAGSGSVLDNFGIIVDAIGGLSGSVGGALQDPQETLHNLLMYGLDRAMNAAMQEIVYKMVEKHLAIGSVGADAYLRNYSVNNGVRGIMLDESVFINSDGDIIIVAEYKIDYAAGLGFLPLPAEMRELTVRQTAKTKAWLGGEAP